MSKPRFVYVTYIAATPEKVWAALTDRKFREYLVRHASRDRLEGGLAWRLIFDDGRVADTGEISRPTRRVASSSNGATNSSRS